MRQKDMIRMTADAVEGDPLVVATVIDAFIDNLLLVLQTEDYVEIRSDFGSFVVRKKGGESVGPTKSISKEQRVVSFKATPTFKKALRQSDQDFYRLLCQKGSKLQIERFAKSTQNETEKKGGDPDKKTM